MNRQETLLEMLPELSPAGEVSPLVSLLHSFLAKKQCFALGKGRSILPVSLLESSGSVPTGPGSHLLLSLSNLQGMKEEALGIAFALEITDSGCVKVRAQPTCLCSFIQ